MTGLILMALLSHADPLWLVEFSVTFRGEPGEQYTIGITGADHCTAMRQVAEDPCDGMPFCVKQPPAVGAVMGTCMVKAETPPVLLPRIYGGDGALILNWHVAVKNVNEIPFDGYEANK